MAFPDPVLDEALTDASPAIPNAHTGYHNAERVKINNTTGELVAHEADSTAVHGIADTSLLETATGAAAKVAAHSAAADPHGDRAFATAADVTVAATGASALSVHVAAADPHPGYLTAAEGNAAYQPVDSDLTAIGALTPTNDDVVQRKAGAWVNSTLATLKTDLALGDVDNTSDANKPVSTAAQTALDLLIPLTQRGAANGVATLDGSGLVPSAQLPAITISDTFTVASQAAMLALTAQRGDVAIRTDLNKSFILKTESPSTLADWAELLTPTDAVTSVNTRSGNVTGLAEATDSRFTDTRTPTDGSVTGAKLGAMTSAQLLAALSDETGTGANVFATSPTLVTPALGTPSALVLTNATGLPAAGVTGTALVSAAIGVTVQAYDVGIDTLRVAFSGVDVPRRSLDRWRGGATRPDTTLTTTVNSTETTFVIGNVNTTRVGCYELLKIDNEEILILRGQASTTLIVRRGVNGTTAAAHTAGAVVLVDRIKHAVALGDSTVQGDATSVTGVWDSWMARTRRIFNDRFGGVLGRGFYGLWKSDFTEAGSWTGVSAASNATQIHNLGPWVVQYGTGSTAIKTWTRAADVRVAAIDILWVDWSSGSALGPGAWSYSLDGGTTWIDNPIASVAPTNTTTLGAADTGRALSYWTGTQTMTVASTTGFPTSGFVQMEVGSVGTYKCSAVFTYGGVSGVTLTNVKYVGDASYNAVTTTTGDTVQMRALITRTRIVTENPTSVKFRCANAAGTSKTCMFAGVDIWSTVPIFGVTRGIKLHNVAYTGNTLSAFINSRTFGDAGTSTASTTLTSNVAAFTTADVGKRLFGPSIAAGAFISAYTSATQVTMSAVASVTITQGASVNTVTVQGMRGGWERMFNGCAASWLPDLVIHGGWSNDMAGWMDDSSEYEGGRSATGNTSTGGTGKTVTLTSGTFQASDVGAIIRTQSVTGIATGSTIASITSSTVAEMNTNASATLTGLTIFIHPTNTTITRSIADKQSVVHTATTLYADTFLIVLFEQGVSRLNGAQQTAAGQALFRAAQHTWADTLDVASLDIYQAWAAHGISGYTAAAVDGYMDTADTSGFHEGPVGYSDMASRVTRTLEVF